MKKKLMLLCVATSFCVAAASSNDKLEAIETLRKTFSQSGMRYASPEITSGAKLIQKLNSDGVFTDIPVTVQSLKDLDYDHQLKQTTELANAFFRLWRIVGDFKKGLIPADQRPLILKSIRHYAKLELERDQRSTARFHGSCFGMPKSAAWIYFNFFDEIERGEMPELADLLTRIAYQSWSHPRRNDATDHNIESVERFRGHVWWVGGNATGYRPLLEAALLKRSPKMIDVLTEVTLRSVSNVSQNTYDKAFWIEGFSADGAGWGHGKQCLVWGYPIHGTNGSLNIIAKLRGTPWTAELTSDFFAPIFDYLRGSAFLFYKGNIPPVLERGNMKPNYADKRNIPSFSLTNVLHNNFLDYLSEEQKKELDQFRKEAGKHNLFMLNFPAGQYHGSRYFFNNDKLARKTPAYYVLVNQSSNRTDGLESAYPMASGYNLFTCDGQTVFERQGGESARAIGAAELTMLPGITARQVKKLNPVTNWRGYGSKGKIAAGAVAPNGDAVSGFLFDKVNRAQVDNPKFKETNPQILGVRAVKSYFFFGDLFFALGSGIENTAPQHPGNLFTTVEQSLSINTEPVTGAPENAIAYRNNGFLYGVLPHATTGKIHTATSRRKTDWKRLSKANKSARESDVELFSLWIDHGKKVKNGTYAYFVACDGKLPSKLPQILSNTPKLQGMLSPDGKTVEALFYDARCVLTTPFGKIRVSVPGALVAQFSDKELTLTFADGTMNRAVKKITVTIDGKPYQFALPDGEQLGAAATHTFAIGAK